MLKFKKQKNLNLFSKIKYQKVGEISFYLCHPACLLLLSTFVLGILRFIKVIKKKSFLMRNSNKSFTSPPRVSLAALRLCPGHVQAPHIRHHNKAACEVASVSGLGQFYRLSAYHHLHTVYIK